MKLVLLKVYMDQFLYIFGPYIMIMSLKDIIEEWQYFEIPDPIERNLNPLEFLSWKVKKIIPLVGFRRTGKTFLLFYIAKKLGKENTLYINFEDIMIKDIDYSKFLRTIREYYGERRLVLLLDEVQELKDWSGWLRSLNDLPNFFIYATGSSSKIGLENIPTNLRGRTLTFYVFPLDFKEFLRFNNFRLEELPSSILLNKLKNFLEYGGMPEIVLETSKGKKLLMANEYFNTFVSRDIIERYKIRNDIAIKYIIKYLFDTTKTSISKMYNVLKSLGHSIGKETLIRYLKYLDETFLFFFIPCYGSFKKREQEPKKVYTIDNIFLRKFSIDSGLGRLMENLVAIELIRRRYNTIKIDDLFYYQSPQGYEIDFVIKQGLEVKELIQVTYASDFDEISPREYRALIKASELFKGAKLTIVTWDYEDQRVLEWWGKKASVRFVPLWKWLTETL